MNYIIFDLEANFKRDDSNFIRETIEIGAVKVNEKLEVIDTFETFIKPLKNPIITDSCTELTTITNADVEHAPSFPEGAELFKNWIDLNEPFQLLSWGHYDKKQLKSDSAIHNLPTDWLASHDSLKHIHYEVILRKKGRAMGMERALQKANIPAVGTHHRGIDDAKNIAKIFTHYFNQISHKIQR